MKKLLATICAGMTLCALASCGGPQGEVKSYNLGINVIPAPQSLVQHKGYFELNNNTSLGATSPEAKTIAEFFASKMKQSTGYEIKVAEQGNISLVINMSTL